MSSDAFHDIAARCALAGWQLWRSDAADGPQRYFLGRNGLVRVAASLIEIEAFIVAMARTTS